MLYVVATCKLLFFIFLFLKIIKAWVKNWVATYINTQVITGTNLNLYLSQQQMKYINLYMCDIHKTCMQYAKLSSPFPLST